MGALGNVAAAAVYPLSGAVLWGGVEGLLSIKETPELQDGTVISGTAGFSKKISDTFSLGAGLNAFWSQAASKNRGMGLSLGFQKDFPQLRIGKSSLSGSLISGGNGPESLYPYTFISGWNSLLLQNPVELSAGIQMATPAFQDVWIHSSTSLTVGKMLTISIGWNNSLIYPENNSWFPTVSFTVNSRSSLKMGQFGMIPRFRVFPVWSQGIGMDTAVTLTPDEKDLPGPMITVVQPLPINIDATPPSGSVRIPSENKDGPVIFSPNGDGVRDLLQIIQNGTKESSWTGAFINRDGKVVRSYTWYETSPPEFVWDGRDAEGNVVDDGSYTYQLSSTDKAGNTFSTTLGPIVVDKEPRRLEVTLSRYAMSTEPGSPFASLQVLFSDYIEKGLLEWTILVVDAQGRISRTWQGNRDNLDRFPKSLQFNGLTDAKEPIPDGLYRFVIKISYDNGDTLIQNSPFFTVQSSRPSGQVRGSRTTISRVNSEGILLYHDLSADAEWNGFITDSQQQIIKKIPLGRNTEAIVRWYGETDSGELVPEGTYFYFAEGVNSVGLTGRTIPIRIRVEPIQQGTILLQSNTEIFSGRAGEGRVFITPYVQDSGSISSYRISIRNLENGAVVKESSGTLPGPFIWDGRDALGVLCPDGVYQAVLKLNLENGKVLTAESRPIKLDSTPPRVKVSEETDIFSPNGDGIRDTTKFIIQAEGGVQWNGAIVNATGEAVRNFSWKGNPPNSLIWDGRDDGDSIVPDGAYRLTLEGFDVAGNRTLVTSNQVILDARKPTAVLSSDLQAFSPNQDGFADVVTLRLVVSFSDGIERFNLEIRDRNGKPIRRLAEGSLLNQSSLFQWDGSADHANALVPDGAYIPWAQIEYTKGDRITVQGKAVLLDRTPPVVAVSFSPESFSPDNDGKDELLAIKLSVTDASEINGWKLSILDSQGTLFTSFSGKSLPQEPILWDGYNLDNKLIEVNKEYSYIVQVRDVLGNMTTNKGTLKFRKR
jgi:hypothetical protein